MKTLHQYRSGHGFESRSGLNFFSGFNFVVITAIINMCSYLISHQFISDGLIAQLQRYRRGHGFESHDQSCLHISSNKLYDLSYVHLHD